MRSFLTVAVLTLCSAATSSLYAQTTYYVRPDGGSAVDCTGTTNAAYPGSGSAQPCAFDHPFRALPPDGSPLMVGGDTLVIGAGSYRMGYGAPGDDNCEAEWAYDCQMPALPSGPDAAHPTRLVGEGWDSGCASSPELWGAERPWHVVSLDGTSNAMVACLEITDHSGCIEGHVTAALACERDTPPFGDWGPIGLFAQDSANVLLSDLDIHGMAAGGVHAGRLHDWTLERVRIYANGFVGFDGDIDDNDSNTGTITFDTVEIGWNGCGETWPGEVVTGCWDQNVGGYGDGIGTGATGGDWVFNDCSIHHNTSDGLDLLYLQAGGSVTVRRTVCEGNAGDQLKTSGSAVVENSLLVSNCGFFDGWPQMSNHCRSGGTAFAMNLYPGDTVSVVNTTLAGEGDCLMIVEGETGGAAPPVVVRSSILVGTDDFNQPGDTTCLYWTDLTPGPMDMDWNLVSGVKDQGSVCPQGANDLCAVDPGLVSSAIDAFDGHLLADSPAVDSGQPVGTVVGSTSVPDHDIEGNGRPQGAGTDRGAYEKADVIFADGFEDEGTGAWSGTVGGSFEF